MGCPNTSKNTRGISFYRFPLADKQRCSKWVAAIRRKDWMPKHYTRICSQHFRTGIILLLFCSGNIVIKLLFSGKPYHHSSHPDYVPSIFPSIYRCTTSSQDFSRHDRYIARIGKLAQQEKESHEAKKIEAQELREKEKAGQKKAIIEEKLKVKEEKKKEKARAEKEKVREQEEAKKKAIEEQKLIEEAEIQRIIAQTRAIEELKLKKGELESKRCNIDNLLIEVGQELSKAEGSERDGSLYRDNQSHVQQQTDESALKLASENAALKLKILGLTCGSKMIEDNDEKTNFYTGLPSWAVFQHTLSFLSPHTKLSTNSLTLSDEFVFVLMRLKLGLLLEDLSTRFNVSIAVGSKIFQKWLEVMYYRLNFLIKWPSREVIKENMPPLIKQLYPECICIIDCSEIYIEMPSRYEARSITYSNYKKHNTIKFLISITPCGSISFLSQCWGGRVSDKVLTQECGFLHHLEPGNVVLADRGFTIESDLAIYGAKLEIPAFTRGKNQLSQREVEYSKQLSTVRIHVERVIGNLKNKFRILKGPLPISMLKHKHDTSIANIDKILRICASLINLSESVV